MAKRTHSTVDQLPAELRRTLMQMLTDGYWPDELPGGHKGKPTYDDCVEYVTLAGHTISRSAFGRWARGFLALELLGSRAEVVRNVMANSDADADSFAANQRAAADLINARILETALSGQLTAKQTRELAGAAKDCMTILINNDKYRQDIASRVEAAKETIGKELADNPSAYACVQKALDEIVGVKK